MPQPQVVFVSLGWQNLWKSVYEKWFPYYDKQQPDDKTVAKHFQALISNINQTSLWRFRPGGPQVEGGDGASDNRVAVCTNPQTTVQWSRELGVV